MLIVPAYQENAEYVRYSNKAVIGQSFYFIDWHLCWPYQGCFASLESQEAWEKYR
jgi:hypothetical protein